MSELIFTSQKLLKKSTIQYLKNFISVLYYLSVFNKSENFHFCIIAFCGFWFFIFAKKWKVDNVCNENTTSYNNICHTSSIFEHNIHPTGRQSRWHTLRNVLHSNPLISVVNRTISRRKKHRLNFCLCFLFAFLFTKVFLPLLYFIKKKTTVPKYFPLTTLHLITWTMYVIFIWVLHCVL